MKEIKRNINDGKNGLIAHRRKSDGAPQSLEEHLHETSVLTSKFASKAGLAGLGKILGLLHDFGKASSQFQNYLYSSEGLISPDEDGYLKARRGEVDHSTAGAQLVHEKLSYRGQQGKILAQFLSLALASHHSGLIDCLKPDGRNEFQRRIEKPYEKTHLIEARQKLPIIERELDEVLKQPIEKQFYKKLFQEMKETSESDEQIESGSTLSFKHGLLARFLLSCLLDADRLNTADFENRENELMRYYGKYQPWSALIDRLEQKFAEFDCETAQMDKGSRAYEVNQLRARVAQSCLDFAKKPKGIYQLTVPTGGGKTLASLRFALHHAAGPEMDRIFYVVPYLTIIDQNADEIRKVLDDKDENGKPLENVVLEHHSNFTPPEDTHHRHNLLAENWDAPIVFTTQVQFLEALFSSGTRDARRMHQLANSVIIFDEVQTVPIKLTHMFTAALRFLAHDCGSTVVLCTATQPPFGNLDNPYRRLKITPEQHIIQNETEVFEKLRRVEVQDERKPGGLLNSEVADLAEQVLGEKGSLLIVVNTRATARELYQAIMKRNLADIYHLSTNMCPAHRMDVLEKVRAKLKADEPVICISTQLIEAGVDIDFGAVIRALAGLDSIAQSAGRCNRHGKRDGRGIVWVVNPQDENLNRLLEIKTGSEKAQTVLDDFKVSPEQFGYDCIGLTAIAQYYGYYYAVKKDDLRYPVGADSIIGREDDLFNLLSLNTLSKESHRRIYQTPPEILLLQSFQSAGKEFAVIGSITRGVVAPWGKGTKVIVDLCSAFDLENEHKLLRNAQRFSVNLFAHQFDNLLKIGAIHEVQSRAGIYYLDKQYYSEEFGWSNEPVGDMEINIA